MMTIQYGAARTLGQRTNTAQGKVSELRMELQGGGKKDKNHSAKKITLKKIVANMTMSNNDMIGLFPDVIGCMTIPSLEIKKMYVLIGGEGGSKEGREIDSRKGAKLTEKQVLPIPCQLFTNEAGGRVEGLAIATYSMLRFYYVPCIRRRC